MKPKSPVAIVSRLPRRNGDGYSWGGEVVLTVGARSVILDDVDFANALAVAWNTPLTREAMLEAAGEIERLQSIIDTLRERVPTPDMDDPNLAGDILDILNAKHSN